MALAPEDSSRAIGLKLASLAMFTIMAALIKASAPEVPAGEAVFFRSFFAIPVVLAWLAMRGELGSGLKTQRPFGHVLRGVAGTTGMALGFTGLGILPLAEVVAIQYVMPILVVILAAIILRETIRLVRLTAVAMGLVGVLIVMWPRFTAFGAEDADPRLALGAALVFASATTAAFAQIFIRRLVETETTAAIAFWFSITGSVAALVTIPFGWTMPPLWALACLIGAGVFGGAGQIALTSAYRYGDASVVAIFEYASILFSIAIGYMFFQEVPTLQVLIGASIVIAAGLLIILRERQLKIRRGKARRHVSKFG